MDVIFTFVFIQVVFNELVLKDIINIQDHSINIDYENNKLLIKGSGYILLQEKAPIGSPDEDPL